MLARGDVGSCRHVGLGSSGQSEFHWGTVSAPLGGCTGWVANHASDDPVSKWISSGLQSTHCIIPLMYSTVRQYASNLALVGQLSPLL